MEWMSRLGPRAGPLLEAAQRFLTGHPGAPDGALDDGPRGLRALARAIDEWAEREEVSSDDEEGFVEGAGALLGLLLLAHVGEGEHRARDGVHRLRLGRHGFFDPFASVERALEGPDAGEVLVDEVGRAEAEAAGVAGLGRALAILERRLGALRPERSVRSSFGPDVLLDDGVELDLGRVLRAIDGEGEDAAIHAIDKLVSMLPGSGATSGLGWEEAAARLVPRLTASGFSERLAAEGRGALAARPLFDGALEVALVLAYDDRSRYVRVDELAGWSQTFDAALAAAVLNLAARSENARFARVDTSAGPLVVARTGDGLDGARLLLPSLHDVLAPELGTPLLAAVPHRDALFACAFEPASLREALVARVREDAARAPHRISQQLFRVDVRGIRPT